MTVDEHDNPVAGNEANAIRLYLTRHLETRGDESSVTEYQTTCLCEDGVHVRVESPVALRANDDFGYDFRDPKVECGMGGEALDPDRAYMVTATNLPVSEFGADAADSAVPASAPRIPVAGSLILLRASRGSTSRTTPPFPP